jgi:hypothetical protein
MPDSSGSVVTMVHVGRQENPYFIPGGDRYLSCQYSFGGKAAGA